MSSVAKSAHRRNGKQGDALCASVLTVVCVQACAAAGLEETPLSKMDSILNYAAVLYKYEYIRSSVVNTVLLCVGCVVLLL